MLALLGDIWHRCVTCWASSGQEIPANVFSLLLTFRSAIEVYCSDCLVKITHRGIRMKTFGKYELNAGILCKYKLSNSICLKSPSQNQELPTGPVNPVMHVAI